MVDEPQDLTEEGVSVTLEDDKDESSDENLSPLVQLINQSFTDSKNARSTAEERWLDANRNFRGLYGDRVKFTSTETSRAFIKITKTKVQAGYGQILDVIFGNGQLPISVSPTLSPTGIDETVHFDSQDPKKEIQIPEDLSNTSVVGFDGDGEDLEPGETLSSRTERVLDKLFKGIKFGKGAADTPQQRTVKPAEIAAFRMEKRIKDQLNESNAVNHVCDSIFESCLLGTGILKGPFTVRKEKPRWNPENGDYEPEIEISPKVSHVSVWDFYPDPIATDMDDVKYVIQRHNLSKSQLRALKKRAHFRSEKINLALEGEPDSNREHWETQISESSSAKSSDRYEVLEYWGTVDIEFVIDELDQTIPKNLKDQEEFQINAWVCNGILIRVVLNPFTPARIPYHVFHYEQDPYNFFGVGIAENMSDTQALMNGFVRMAVDNAVKAGNIMVEVDKNSLVPGQSMDVFPGKVWERESGAPGQAIFATTWPSTGPQNMDMFERMKQLADESTGLSNFASGQPNFGSVGRSAAGMSMLINSSSLNTKTVIKNIDNNLLQSLGEAMFAWNMQFNFDKDIVGDLSVNARGTANLIQKEVKIQKLLQALQLGQSPALLPYADLEQLWRSFIREMDLNEDDYTLDPEKAQAQASLISQVQQQTGNLPQPSSLPSGNNPNSENTGGVPGPNPGSDLAPVPSSFSQPTPQTGTGGVDES